ncbi:hypothetical protein [Nocardia mexicana]|uniref:Uncharacterized protein n=1 Tax=Nocardia mexicana TaxID=279262 RepID=A0A370H9H5_9NOCA|nr:hypothetical protein [Nocardia mexicana]RDI53325.1 hypothetical protein DFR68_103714 [Nocardia mexicana]
MFLAVFSGAQPVTAGDVLHPAYDLVECQRKYQLALGVMTGTEASAADLKAAAAMLVTAVADIEVLVTIIDDAVAERLKPQRTGPDKVVQVIEADTAATAASPARMQPDQLAPVPLHTESIGEIAARMADLWERAVARGSEPICTPQPETHQLVELCTGYDYLAAEIESGRRTLPGM